MVLERTEIAAVPGRIEGSLIGRDVRLGGADTRPRAYRLVLGDHSEAQITVRSPSPSPSPAAAREGSPSRA